MKELKIKCQKVIKSFEKKEKNEDGEKLESTYDFTNTDLAVELLPNQSGFFFGSEEYNKYYLQDLKDTIKIINKTLKHEEGEIYYSSSW